MDLFENIDAERRKHGLTRKAIYERAGVNGETWRRLARNLNAPNTRTLKRLRAALDELLAEKDAGHGVVAHARSDNDQRKESHGEV